MKTTKKMSLKITTSILTVLLVINFIFPTYSNADVGGVLMDPICDLICSICDVVINVLQKCMTGDWEHFDLFNGGLLATREEYENGGFKVTDSEGEEKPSQYEMTVEPYSDEHPFNKNILRRVQEYYIPILKYSPEEIFAGKLPGLDVNFINPGSKKTDKGEEMDSANILQPTIASWYVALRNLSIVVLLSVLVYVGIRIVISSTASDKAKYKQMLMDWLIALCILFFMHYIMSFTLTITQSICDALSGDGADSVTIKVEGDKDYPNLQVNTNLAGMARFLTQYNDLGSKLTYLIMYIGMVIYTVMFTWFYLKRLLKMAFLTLIAPLVALTYPIDKMGDSKAQAFNSWLKEYIFNALIQPFHLIIYTVFIGSAISLVANNVIYALAAMGFILPAEKILRTFFGFDKAGTLGGLGEVAVGSALGRILSGGSKDKNSVGKSSGGNNLPQRDDSVRFDGGQDLSQIEGDSGENSSLPPPNTGSGDDGNDTGDEALRKYSEEGYGQNANGEYYNPWTDEYDPNYDPRNDASYNLTNTNNSNNSAQQQAAQQQAAQQQAAQQAQQQKNNKFKFKNWANAHGISGKTIAKGMYKGTKKTIGGAIRFTAKKTFKAAGSMAGGLASGILLGTIPAGVALATGGGLKGAAAAFGIAAAPGVKAGGNIGEKLGNSVANVGGSLYSGAERLGIATAKYAGRDKEAFKDELLGGTALGRELDYGHGDKRYQTAGKQKDNWSSQETRDYVKEKWMANNGGMAPNKSEIDAEMQKLMPYLNKKLNAKEAYKALGLESYGIDTKDAAIMAAYSKENGITADKLNDKKFIDALTRNISKSLEDKGIAKATSDSKAQYIVNGMKIYNGVAHTGTPQNQGLPTPNQPRTANTTQNSGATGNTSNGATRRGTTRRGRRPNS